MTKIILNKDQIQDLVWKNRYKIENRQKFLSRCVDGRYLKDNNLPPLAFPGADAGELALIFAAANTYGFEIDEEKVFASLLEVVGGVKNINFPSVHHGDPKIPASGCGHIKQMTQDPKAYNLEEKHLLLLRQLLDRIKKQGASEIMLEGEHLEAAVLQIKGNYSLYPAGCLVETNAGKTTVQVFVYHSDLTNQRHRKFALTLIEKKAVKLFPGCDEEYLYEALSEVSESHLFETLKRLASGLPIFQVSFDSDGSFTIEEMGKV